MQICTIHTPSNNYKFEQRRPREFVDAHLIASPEDQRFTDADATSVKLLATAGWRNQLLADDTVDRDINCTHHLDMCLRGSR